MGVRKRQVTADQEREQQTHTALAWPAGMAVENQGKLGKQYSKLLPHGEGRMCAAPSVGC